MHTSLNYSVTAHADDGQARPKHVGAANWENAYHLVHFVGCFISSCSGNCMKNDLKGVVRYTLG